MLARIHVRSDALLLYTCTQASHRTHDFDFFHWLGLDIGCLPAVPLSVLRFMNVTRTFGVLWIPGLFHRDLFLWYVDNHIGHTVRTHSYRAGLVSFGRLRHPSSLI